MGLLSALFSPRARRHFQGLEVLREADANSLGVESAGRLQVRGNGNLALTAEELLFAQWVPDRLLRVPRRSIAEVTTARAHLGKSIGRDLLRVAWTNDQGMEDSVALWVKDLDGWLAALAPAD